ncbi:hypothetical protein Ddc_22513 [Ditylenchus destructor]|nr:hypothetical protein Ddc_22513 [Ditylenchus destructor]
MRRSARLAGKQTNSEKEAQKEPKAKKSRSDNRMPNIVALDNGTMVEAFKFLNYCQLATSSHVSKRFWNLIRTHRHKLALLDVNEISMGSAKFGEPELRARPKTRLGGELDDIPRFSWRARAQARGRARQPTSSRARASSPI